MPETADVKYRIDAQDSLVSINDAWVAEAKAAAEPSWASPTILGCGLWQLIKDSSLQHLFGGLFHRLRVGAVPQVTYLFRCDTPALRRLHRLTITSDPDHSLDFSSVIVAVHERPRVSLLDTASPRSTDLLRICSWCKRIPLPDQRWVEIEDALGHLAAFDRGPLPALSHGICPTCEQTMLTLLEKPSTAGPDVATFGDWHSA